VENMIERIIALAFFFVVAINQIFPLKQGAKIQILINNLKSATIFSVK
jgi:hypothetical protein